MVETIVISGLDGEVFAPIGDGKFIQARRLDIRITATSEDEDVPLAVRQGLIGMTISTIFSPEQVHGAVPEGSRVAYASEVAEAFRAAGQHSLADELCAACESKSPGSEYYFIVFRATEYELVH